MVLSDSQLEPWAQPGSNVSAKRTYDSIKNALSSYRSLWRRNPNVFLQGSYANATNIRSDSDVDIVVQLQRVWFSDKSALSPDERSTYDSSTSSASYGFRQFRDDVEKALRAQYGAADVDPRNKCIKVRRAGGYLDADVVPAIEYRRYSSYRQSPGSYVDGVAFKTRRDGQVIANFPEQHKTNGQDKNKRTNELYKPVVRMLKRARREALRTGRLPEGTTSSYLLECMAYNAPDRCFTEDGWQGRFVEVVAFWIDARDNGSLERFEAQSGQHGLFADDPGGWDTGQAHALLNALTSVLLEK